MRRAPTGTATTLASRSSFFSPRVFRFCAVGFSGVFVNLGGLWIFADHFGINDELSSAVAIEFSIVWNFLLNNAWTFKDRNDRAQTRFFARMLRYNLVSLVGLGIQLGTFIAAKSALIDHLGLADIGVWKYFAQTLGIGLATIWSFLSNFYWTWAQTSSPNEE